MTRVAIVGATGYSGVELTVILARHPDVELVAREAADPDPLGAGVEPVADLVDHRQRREGPAGVALAERGQIEAEHRRAG